jgi:hypothetical protein
VEELHDLYFSHSIMRMMQLRRITWAGHTAPLGEKINAYRVLE